MENNINTKEYWDNKFSSDARDENRRRLQTKQFCLEQIKYLQLSPDFCGTLLDFGCGLGDAIPVYKANYPKCKLIGIDISQSAIDQCCESYGHIATFIQGDFSVITNSDVIIASNVLEHLSDDITIVKDLLSKCKDLYIIVPFNEYPLHHEHVNAYNESTFTSLAVYDYQVYSCPGWSFYGWQLWYEVISRTLPDICFVES